MANNILFIKNFSGDFNDSGIGHEVINMFDTNNKEDYIPFYVPPYGMVFSEKKNSFMKSTNYKNIDTLVIFDSTNITNVFKLKAIATNIGYYNNYEEIVNDCNKFTYGDNNVKLIDIKFGDDEFRDNLKDKEFVSRITYKVYKNHYYNFENDKILIWCKSTDVRNNLKQNSIEKCNQIYGCNPKVLDNTIIGQKNYIYKTLGDDFNKFVKDIIDNECNDNHLYQLNSISNQNSNITYNIDNLFEHLQKTNDENLVTNFICYVLNLNIDLRKNFLSFLVSKAFNISNYVPSNIKEVYKQYAIKVHDEASNKDIKGILDMYIQDDKYSIIIENKIDSSINGKHADIDKDIDQLKTYNKYLKDNHIPNSKVILLVPYKYYNVYKNYNIDTLTITYKDVYTFFKDNESLIKLNNIYKNDFLNLLYKHSLTREEDIINRFYNTLNK